MDEKYFLKLLKIFVQYICVLSNDATNWPVPRNTEILQVEIKQAPI